MGASVPLSPSPAKVVADAEPSWADGAVDLRLKVKPQGTSVPSSNRVTSHASRGQLTSCWLETPTLLKLEEMD